MDNRQLYVAKRIALVAHDNKKKDLLEWVKFNKETLKGHELYGTGTTARLIQEKVKLEIVELLSGPLGGDQQIGSMIVFSLMAAILFKEPVTLKTFICMLLSGLILLVQLLMK